MQFTMTDDVDAAVAFGCLMTGLAQKYPGRPFLKIIQDAADFTGKSIWDNTLNNQSLVKMLERYLNGHD